MLVSVFVDRIYCVVWLCNAFVISLASVWFDVLVTTVWVVVVFVIVFVLVVVFVVVVVFALVRGLDIVCTPLLGYVVVCECG